MKIKIISGYKDFAEQEANEFLTEHPNVQSIQYAAVLTAKEGILHNICIEYEDLIPDYVK